VSWLRIVVTYALAIALSVHLAGVSAERAAVQPEGKGGNEPFLVAVAERIDRVRLEQEGMAVQFERRDGRWITVEPEGLASPGDIVDAILDSLTTLPPVEVVSEGTGNDEQFGFTPPRARVRLEQQGTVVSTVVFGELSPTRTAVYARQSGKDEVALVGLNAKYYMDLVFENVRRQKASAGAAAPSPRR
jgi:hypothetical protein